MKYEEIIENYHTLDKKIKYRKELLNKISDILDRGYVCCNNDNVCNSPIFLLTGINPSFSEKEPEPAREYTFAEAKGRYWSKKQQQFGDLKGSMAYMDLFPIRERHQQGGFEKVFREANDIKAEFLEITQMAIEDMSPKMIIHANRDSMYYWGIKKYGGGNDAENPWMGYTVERLTRQNTPDLPQCMTDEKLVRFPLYRILGLTDSPKRINSDKIKQTNLTYIMEYVMEYRRKEDKDKWLYKPGEWQKISEWLNR